MHVYDKIHHYFDHFISREVKELYISTAIRVLGLGMIALFAPIYLYQLGFSIQKIILFYVMMQVYYLIMIPLTGKIVARIGYEASMGVGVAFLPVYFLLLYLLPQYAWLFWVAPLAITMYRSFYWTAFHSDFIRFGNTKRVGEEIGWFRIIVSMVGVIAPTLGGILLTYTNFTILFIVVSIVFLASLVPLYTTKEEVVRAHFSIRKLIKKSLSKKTRRDFVAIFGDGDTIIAECVWPIFLATVVTSYISMGLLTTAAILITFLVLLYVGKRANQSKRKKMLRLNSFLVFAAWLARIFSFNGFYVFFTDSFFKVATQSMGTLVTSIFYSRMRKENILYYVAFREMALSLSRIILGSAAILMFYFTDTLWYAFILAAAVALFANFWDDLSEEDLKTREF